jgi:hypothetical protein
LIKTYREHSLILFGAAKARLGDNLAAAINSPAFGSNTNRQVASAILLRSEDADDRNHVSHDTNGPGHVPDATLALRIAFLLDHLEVQGENVSGLVCIQVVLYRGRRQHLEKTIGVPRLAASWFAGVVISDGRRRDGLPQTEAEICGRVRRANIHRVPQGVFL